MIDSGEKQEEYRAITPYWKKRFKCRAGIPAPESCSNCPFGAVKHWTLYFFIMVIPVKQ